jgi:HEXXH motif-containing protein
MGDSFVSNPDLCAARARSYWAALRLAGLKRRGDFETGQESNYTLRSLAWPLSVYGRPNDARDPVALNSTTEGWFTADLLTSQGIQEVVGDRAPDHCVYLATSPSSEIAGKLKDAVSMIQQFWPEAFLEVSETIRGFAFVRSQRKFSSTSDPKIFGLIHLDEEFYASRSVAELATAILHETGHHSLFVETSRVKLISEPGKILYSPLRKQHRPAIGVLHAAVALYRMISWGRRISGLATSEADRIAFDLVPKYTATLEELNSIEFLPSAIGLRLDLEQLKG